MTINEYLLEQGVIVLTGTINNDASAQIICQLKYLDAKYPHRTIQIWIISPAISNTAGMAIRDMMNMVKVPVQTYLMGRASGITTILLSSGSRGERYATESSEIVLQQPFGEVQGQTTDIYNAATHIMKIKDRYNEILSKNSRQDFQKVSRDTERDCVMTASEAKEYGLIDHVLTADVKAW